MALVGWEGHESARTLALNSCCALLSSVQVKLEKTRLEPAGEGKDQTALGTGARRSCACWAAVWQP